MSPSFSGKLIIEWGVASRPIPGQTLSGDLHMVKPFANGALVAVVDGLGHGDEATAAARAAIAVLEENPDLPVITLVKRCHEALGKTRGAVVTLASFSVRDDSVSWLSVGNVEGLLLRSDTKASPAAETALHRSGVVGFQLPPLHASVMDVSPGDLLILATDGIRSGFERSVILTDSPQQNADRIMNQQFKGNDDALVLVVRFLEARHEHSL